MEYAPEEWEIETNSGRVMLIEFFSQISWNFQEESKISFQEFFSGNDYKKQRRDGDGDRDRDRETQEKESLLNTCFEKFLKPSHKNFKNPKKNPKNRKTVPIYQRKQERKKKITFIPQSRLCFHSRLRRNIYIYADKKINQIKPPRIPIRIPEWIHY